MPGHLFTEYFLTDGIRHTPERQSQRPAFVAFRDAARRLFQDFAAYHEPNETQTEQELIRPLLQLLGWTDDISQPTAPGGEDRPDLLLYQDTQAKARATSSEASPYLAALAVAELKPFRRLLDTRGPGKGTQASSPHAQILRYLRSADTVTDGNLRWGILTNGAVWRLYDQKNRTHFFEADLEALLEADDENDLRTFHLLFRRTAFVRTPGAAATFLETALDQGRRYEQRVAQSLAGVVFQRVFPRLLQALADADHRPMPAIREAALIFLYRLLFVLYAEDRGLLPVNDAAYDDYGLRKRVRDDVAKRKTRSDTFSTTASSYYSHLTDLFAQIDQGDPSIGLPPYNGGLFTADAAPLLNQVRLPDDVIADVVYDLSHTQDNGQPRYVNYRDMSVQQLGSIYERLLEQQPELGSGGKVRIRPNPYARKDSGSFYTPQDLVNLIVEQTLKPLVDERRAAFAARAKELRGDRRSRASRKAELARLDTAEAVLDLKVLDPAMGSGHFLVTAVDFLTDAIVDLIEPSASVTGWLGDDDPYHSPLLDRVAAIRDAILQRAAESGWVVNEAQLTDQAIIRRLVLKRCIYGVDKNPLTVELAKVSLWLHSFTVGAPLSFLDHHLRCGDSLLGLRIADAKTELQRLNVPMFVSSALQGVENAAHGMRQIEQLTDADVAEVHQSETLFHAVESATADLRGFLNTLAGLRWHTAGMRVRQRATFEAPVAETLGADPTQAFTLLSQGAGSSSPVGVPLVGTQSPFATTVRGEPGRSPSRACPEPVERARVQPHLQATNPVAVTVRGEPGGRTRRPVSNHPPDEAPNPNPPSSPSPGVGAASPTRPSSAQPLPGSAVTVRGEPGRSPSEARVEPHSPATMPEPPSHPSDVGAASPTRPSSAQPLPGSAVTVRGEPGRSPSEARVEPHSPATMPEPPSHPSDVGAASPTRPSSAQPLPGSAVTVRGEPGRSPSEARVEPHSPATMPEPPSHPSDVGAASPTRPSSARDLTHQHPSPKEPDPAFTTLLNQAKSIAKEESFLHWEAAFPGVWRHWQNQTPEGGFDAVIGNPPWDRIKLQEVEWFATRDPELARAPTAAARRQGIKRLREQGDPLAESFDQAKSRADRLGQVIRASGHYPLLGGGDINLYSLFVERSLRLVKPGGLVGLLTPSGIYADKTAARFFKSVSTTGRVAGIYDFENKKIFFKDIHASFKFCALIVGGAQRTFPETRCAFFLHDTNTIADSDRAFALSPDDFARVNPNTGTAPVFRTRRDADLTRRIYQDHPVLVDRSGDEERRVWPVRYSTMFHMTNDSNLFRTAAQLEDEGFYPIQGNRWKRGKELYLPLYQGRMIQHFDHRASSVRINLESTHNPYLSEETSGAQHRDPDFLPRSQYWVPASEVGPSFPKCGYALGFRDIARPTDVRTVIATVVPQAGYGNTLPLLLKDGCARNNDAPEIDVTGLDASNLALFAANLNSMCLDFVARQKAQGTHLNWYIVEQLPVLAPDAYDRRFGDRTAADLVRDHVLRLTYTAHDMAPFARDLGHHGPPFPWDDEDRRHLRARLDALYFHLYGLTRHDAAYILSTFPIIQRQDKAAFGTYRTRTLILAYMNALTAGDTDTTVQL